MIFGLKDIFFVFGIVILLLFCFRSVLEMEKGISFFVLFLFL